MEHSTALINLILEIEAPEFGGKSRILTLEDVNTLLEKGADPSYNNNEAFKLAICCCSIDIIRALLADKRIDPTDIISNVDVRNTVVHDTDLTKLLLEDGRVDFSLGHNRTIFLTERDGHNEAKELLLQNEKVRETSDPKAKYWKY